MIRHANLVSWEKKLKTILDQLDDHLETRYGGTYNLHPARARRGQTSNKAHDGLFDIVASFSLGTGSQHGKGYVIDVHMATLDHIPCQVQEEIKRITLSHLRKTLPNYFPGTHLQVDMDGALIKIHGDLSLGDL